MEKIIDVNQPLYHLIQQYPEIQEMMYDIGFKDIKNPAIVNTVGRYMTIAKGVRMKKKEMSDIVSYFENKGFKVEGM